MFETMDQKLFDALAHDFTEAFVLGNEAVAELHQMCTERGLAEQRICLARKAAATIAFSGEANQ